MVSLHNSRMLRALRQESVDQTPMWVMRQAGRYLPEYRELRQQAPDFMDFCRQPELAMQATLQPLARFPLDAAILFSDILTVPDAMGSAVHFEAGVGPVISQAVNTAERVQALIHPDVEAELGYVADAVRLIKQELPGDIPLIGFCGSPWTIACYQVCGGSQRDFWDVRQMSYKAPALLQQLLDKITQVSIDYLLMQARAGADILMLFDSWGGLLTQHQYETFSLQYMQRIVNAVHLEFPDLPCILFSRGAAHAIPKLTASGCQAIGVDWMTPLDQARQMAGDDMTLQGNLDPAVLLGDQASVVRETKRMLDRLPSLQNYIANLGHGIYQYTPIDNMACFVETVQQHSRQRIAAQNA